MSCTSVPNAHLIFYCTKQKCTNVLVYMKSAVVFGRMYRTNKTTTSTEPCHSPSGLQRAPSPHVSISLTQNELYQKSVPFTVTSADVCLSLHLHSPPKDHSYSSEIMKQSPVAPHGVFNLQCRAYYKDLNYFCVTITFLRSFTCTRPSSFFSFDLSSNTALSISCYYDCLTYRILEYHEMRRSQLEIPLILT